MLRVQVIAAVLFVIELSEGNNATGPYLSLDSMNNVFPNNSAIDVDFITYWAAVIPHYRSPVCCLLENATFSQWYLPSGNPVANDTTKAWQQRTNNGVCLYTGYGESGGDSRKYYYTNEQGTHRCVIADQSGTRYELVVGLYLSWSALAEVGAFKIVDGIQFKLLTSPSVDPPVFQLTCTSSRTFEFIVQWTLNGTTVEGGNFTSYLNGTTVEGDNFTTYQILRDPVLPIYENILVVKGNNFGLYACSVILYHRGLASTASLLVENTIANSSLDTKGKSTICYAGNTNGLTSMWTVMPNNSVVRISDIYTTICCEVANATFGQWYLPNGNPVTNSSYHGQFGQFHIGSGVCLYTGGDPWVFKYLYQEGLYRYEIADQNGATIKFFVGVYGIWYYSSDLPYLFDGIQFKLLTSPSVNPPVFQLTCTSSRSPATTVQWTLNGTTVQGGNFTSYQIVADQVLAVYTNILVVTGKNFGLYGCNVTTFGTSIASDRTKFPISSYSSLLVTDTIANSTLNTKGYSKICYAGHTNGLTSEWTLIPNNSLIIISDTYSTICCEVANATFGQWYLPNGNPVTNSTYHGQFGQAHIDSGVCLYTGRIRGSFYNSQLNQQGVYNCMIVDQNGVTNEFFVGMYDHINNQPKILDGIHYKLLTSPSVDLPVFQLTCTSSRAPATTVQWTLNGSIVEGGNFTSFQIVRDPVLAVYENILVVSGRNFGFYSCNSTTTLISSNEYVPYSLSLYSTVFVGDAIEVGFLDTKQNSTICYAGNTNGLTSLWTVVQNNSVVLVSSTYSTICCKAANATFRQWYLPDGNPVANSTYRVQFGQIDIDSGVCLFTGGVDPWTFNEYHQRGVHRCVTADQNGAINQFFVGVYSFSNGLYIEGGIQFKWLSVDPPVFQLTCTSSLSPVTAVQWTLNGTTVEGGNFTSYQIVGNQVYAYYDNILVVTGKHFGMYACNISTWITSDSVLSPSSFYSTLLVGVGARSLVTNGNTAFCYAGHTNGFTSMWTLMPNNSVVLVSDTYSTICCEVANVTSGQWYLPNGDSVTNSTYVNQLEQIQIGSGVCLYTKKDKLSFYRIIQPGVHHFKVTDPNSITNEFFVGVYINSYYLYNNDGMKFKWLSVDPPVFQLTCTSSSAPATNVQWTLNGTTVQGGNFTSYQIATDGVSAVYENIMIVTGKIFGLYTCSITTLITSKPKQSPLSTFCSATVGIGDGAALVTTAPSQTTSSFTHKTTPPEASSSTKVHQAAMWIYFICALSAVTLL